MHRKSAGNGLRIALSVALVYHLFCVMVAPNPNSYLGQRFLGFVRPYVSFFELASQWGFFAPDPGPPPVFVDYEIVGASGETAASGSWPSADENFFLRERMNRRISVARFVMASSDRIEKTLAPYYCKAYPQAQAVRLWRRVQGMANLYDVAKGKRTIDDGQGTERKWVTQYVCERAT